MLFTIEYIILYYSTQTFKNTVLHKLFFVIELTVHESLFVWYCDIISTVYRYTNMSQ